MKEVVLTAATIMLHITKDHKFFLELPQSKAAAKDEEDAWPPLPPRLHAPAGTLTFNEWRCKYRPELQQVVAAVMHRLSELDLDQGGGLRVDGAALEQALLRCVYCTSSNRRKNTTGCAFK